MKADVLADKYPTYERISFYPQLWVEGIKQTRRIVEHLNGNDYRVKGNACRGFWQNSATRARLSEKAGASDLEFSAKTPGESCDTR